MTNQTAERVRTAEGTLEALSFPATLTPVYDNEGNEIEGFRRVYRPDNDSTLSIVTDQYKLVQHKDALLPAIEVLGKDGWHVRASRIERGGANAFVELTRQDKTVMIAGERVGQRIFMRNSYDRSSSLTFALGAMVCVCSNGLVVPGKGGFGFKSHHVGDVNDKLSFAVGSVGRIEAALGQRMIEHYSKLDTKVPDEIGREIIKRSLGEKLTEKVATYWLSGIGRNGEATGWNLYNGITQHLTHDFKGGWDLRERKNEQSLKLITQWVETGVLPKLDAEAN